jgi:hypothetical protein
MVQLITKDFKVCLVLISSVQLCSALIGSDQFCSALISADQKKNIKMVSIHSDCRNSDQF